MWISRHYNRRGFTLIELLVVIAIIGILTTIASISLIQARRRARDTKRVADIQQVRSALLIYSNQRATYPATPAGGGILGSGNAACLDDSVSGFNATCGAGGELVIMQRVPADIAGGTGYVYSKTEAQSYAITFTLEGTVENLDGNCTATENGITCSP